MSHATQSEKKGAERTREITEIRASFSLHFSNQLPAQICIDLTPLSSQHIDCKPLPPTNEHHRLFTGTEIRQAQL